MSTSRALAFCLAVLIAAPSATIASDAPAPQTASAPPEVNDSYEFARQYKQTHYQYDDFQGDVSLMVLYEHIPWNMVKYMVRGAAPTDQQPHDPSFNPVVDPPPQPAPPPSEPPLTNEARERLAIAKRNSEKSIQGHRNYLRVDAAARMLVQIMREELQNGIVPHFGRPHAWSKEFLQYYQDTLLQHPPFGYSPKLLIALEAGLTWRFLVTGRERALYDYMMSRPDASIQIHELFRESYRLNNGDVYLTLLTIENVLNEYWRMPDRERRATTRKLVSITNTYNDQDKFGTWYHMFGAMLYGYVVGNLIYPVGWTEIAGAFVLARGRDQTQKAWSDLSGGAVGVKLREAMQFRYYDPGFYLGPADYTDPKIYLDRSEDFRDRIEIYESPDLETSLIGDALSIQSVRKDYRACRLDVIPDRGDGFDSESLVSFPGLDFSRGATVSLRLSYDPPPRAVRVFLDCAGGANASKTVAQKPTRPGTINEWDSFSPHPR